MFINMKARYGYMKTVLVCANDFYPNNVFGLGDSVYDVVEKLKYRFHFIVITTNKKDAVYDYPVIFLDEHLDNLLMNGRNLSFKVYKSYDNVIAWNQALFIRTIQYLSQHHIKPDVIMNHSWVTWNLSYELKKKYHIPIINVIHFYEKQYEYCGTIQSIYHDSIVQTDHNMFINADRNVVLNNNMLNSIIFNYGLIHTDNFITIPHSLNIHAVVQPQAIDKNNLKFLYVGRLSTEKGIKELLQAFNILTQKHSNITLTIVGSVILESDLLNKNQNPKINFLGRLTHELLYEEYNKANVVISPSITETFGLVLLEALYFERAIITTSGLTVSDIIPDTVALTVPLKIQDNCVSLSVEELLNKIETLIIEPERILQMSKASKRFFTQMNYKTCEYDSYEHLIKEISIEKQ